MESHLVNLVDIRLKVDGMIPSVSFVFLCHGNKVVEVSYPGPGAKMARRSNEAFQRRKTENKDR